MTSHKRNQEEHEYSTCLGAQVLSAVSIIYEREMSIQSMFHGPLPHP